MRASVWTALLALLGGALLAGELPKEFDPDRTALPRTDGDLVIRGATVLPVSGQAIPNTKIVVRQGRIERVAEGEVDAPADAYRIDAEGAFVTPGIIDAHSHIAIRGGVNESTASVTAEVRIQDEINPDDPAIFRALAGGCTAANLLHGSANAIGGQNAVIKLKYKRPARELLIEDAPRGIKFALGENPTRASSPERGNGRYPATRMGVEAVIRRALREAVEYRERWRAFERALRAGEDPMEPRRDLRLETLVSILEGETLVHCHAYTASEMLMLMRLAEDFGFRIATFQHVLEGYRIAPELARHGAGASTFSDWWAYKVEAYEAIPYNAALMHRAGVLVSLNSDSSELMRRLNLEAAKAVKYGGVDETDALAMVTLNPARQLGIDHRVGSIEPGKDADLVIWNGPPLSAYSRVLFTIVEGEVFFRREGHPSALDLDLADTATPGDVQVDAAPVARDVDPPVSVERLAIVGATVHPMSGPVVPRGVILVADGRIEEVVPLSDGKRFRVPRGYEAVDAEGLHAWPGMIDPSTYLGLTEVSSVPATQDMREQGSFQPDLRTLVAVDPDSAHIPVARANGVTAAVVRPRGALVMGQSALIQTDGFTWEEMRRVDPLALHVSTPGWGSRTPETPLGDIGDDVRTKELKTWFERARAYAERLEAGADLPADPRLEALLPYARGERPVIFDADDEKAIRQVIALCHTLDLRGVVCGGREAFKAAQDLARADVPVLLGPVLSNPSDADDPYDAPFCNAAILYRAGVRFAFATHNASAVRNLPYHAAMSVAFGLDREEAERAVTLRPAEILGVDRDMGSIEPGKIADLVLTDGDLLEVRTHVKAVFVGGRRVQGDPQTRLFERYSRRLEHAAR